MSNTKATLSRRTYQQELQPRHGVLLDLLHLGALLQMRALHANDRRRHALAKVLGGVFGRGAVHVHAAGAGEDAADGPARRRNGRDGIRPRTRHLADLLDATDLEERKLSNVRKEAPLTPGSKST